MSLQNTTDLINKDRALLIESAKRNLSAALGLVEHSLFELAEFRATSALQNLEALRGAETSEGAEQ